jgi:hypothetical protein
MTASTIVRHHVQGRLLYYRPQFTTGSKKYEWLNQIQAVGKMVSVQRGTKIKYDWFIVR